LWRTTKTTTNALEWALSEFIFHPEMMKKTQQEFNKIVGKNKLVLESNLPNLSYLQTIKVTTLTLGSGPRQGVARLHAKRETRE
jgi:hypothetical protein